MKTLNMRRIIGGALLLLGLSTISTAKAQDDQYFNDSWWSCELSGTETVWQVLKYKENIRSEFPTLDSSGFITFSDDCIEIKIYQLEMHFPVGSYKRLTDNTFCVERNGEDDYFDYIEVIMGYGAKKNLCKMLMGFRDPDGTMQNVRVFVCKPVIKPVTKKSASGGTVTVRSSDGIPPQVPKL